MEKFGAIDIGTNAARLLIGEIDNKENQLLVKKISYTRLPLRLGDDVFEKGKISKSKSIQFIKTIEAFKLISEIFNVKILRTVATSAMREASNAKEIIKEIQERTNVSIDVISGQEEAELILSNFFIDQKNAAASFLVIDVGGGSTEISYFHKGSLKSAQSFQIGTIRMLKNKVKRKEWHNLESWLKNEITLDENTLIYGTGGNINKLQKLLGYKQSAPISLEGLLDFYGVIEPLSIDERINKFQLKQDRADVIVPALEIYILILQKIKGNSIFVPKVGLCDGMILKMYNSTL